MRLALTRAVLTRATQSSAMPMAMMLWGSHSGVCKGVGATSSARQELSDQSR